MSDVEKVAAFYALYGALRRNLAEGRDEDEVWASFLDCLALVDRFDRLCSSEP